MEMVDLIGMVVAKAHICDEVSISGGCSHRENPWSDACDGGIFMTVISSRFRGQYSLLHGVEGSNGEGILKIRLLHLGAN